MNDYLKTSTTGNLCSITSQPYHVTVNGGATPAPRPLSSAPACEDKKDCSFCEPLVKEQSFVGLLYLAKSVAMIHFTSLLVPLSVLADSKDDSVAMLQISKISKLRRPMRSRLIFPSIEISLDGKHNPVLAVVPLVFRWDEGSSSSQTQTETILDCASWSSLLS